MEHFAMRLEWSGLRIINYHRPLSAILRGFFESGLVMDGFYEPLPDPNSPSYEDEHRVPNFQIYKLQKPLSS
jgi:hypothetical protein